ncbi:MAG: hypothetical protein SPL30_04835 [Succinivibrio sp.]|nr:hypothetical protein [Succinivibrio sp.]
MRPLTVKDIPRDELQKEFQRVLSGIFENDIYKMAKFFQVKREAIYYWEKAGIPAARRQTLEIRFPEKWKKAAAPV